MRDIQTLTAADWYDHRDELEPGDVFRDRDGGLVRLDRRVPGDGTDWYVLDWYQNGWTDENKRIHPLDLKEKISLS